MQRNQVGTLLKKQQYETPKFDVETMEKTDVITSSGVGAMTWGWTGDWTQSRDTTFVG